MFTKTANYVFDLDPIREPLSERFYTTPAGQLESGIATNGLQSRPRVPNNPLGRNPGSVWHIPPTNYKALTVQRFLRNLCAAFCWSPVQTKGW